MKNKLVFLAMMVATSAYAQHMPRDYASVLSYLGKKGDYKANVLKVNIPRNDLKIRVDGTDVPTPFGFGGWIAMTRGRGGAQVMMGDLVLLQEEVNPVMSSLLDHGLQVTAPTICKGRLSPVPTTAKSWQLHCAQIYNCFTIVQTSYRHLQTPMTTW